ncbi:hypothetical protein C2E23DRAFT_226518 [Lenzites betulinus]|nr:hypothetical protein C2E23DRAFT_226518 [Lenzites betulinus]
MDLSQEYSRLKAHYHDLELVDSLNELLTKLDMHLPFPLDSAFDLTPSLLLGILESILEARLPISAPVRASRDFANKVQAMKIFLGVFESDVLGGMDVGLSDIDPRRLAAGEEEESVFVGELLCWLGRQRGILPPDAGPSRTDDLPPTAPSHRRSPRAVSPSNHSTITSGIQSNLSLGHTVLAETDTTVLSVVSEPLAPLAPAELPDLPTLPLQPDHGTPTGRSTPTRRPPRCIHEVEDPSFLADADFSLDGSASVCECEGSDVEDDLPAAPKTPRPVRRTGWISSADEKSQLDFYYSRRAPSSAPATVGRRVHSYPGLGVSTPTQSGREASGSAPRRILTPHNAPTQYTLALLNEKAHLLDKLAKLQAASLKSSPPGS